MSRGIPGKTNPVFRITNRLLDLAKLGGEEPGDHPVDQYQEHAGSGKQPSGGVDTAEISAVEVFKVGEAIVPSKASLVSEEENGRRIGEGLGQNGEVDPLDP